MVIPTEKKAPKNVKGRFGFVHLREVINDQSRFDM